MNINIKEKPQQNCCNNSVKVNRLMLNDNIHNYSIAKTFFYVKIFAFVFQEKAKILKEGGAVCAQLKQG